MKKVTNIRPLEVVEDGNRSVQYKGRDGKMHDIAPTPQQTAQQASPGSGSAVQSVVVGTVTVVNYKPTITLDELLPDRFYRIDSTNGSCLIATSMEDGELAMRIIGNTRQGLDSEIVETIALDEQDKWVLTLSGWAGSPVMTLLNEHDTIAELALNHQSLFEDFLNYTLLGSMTYSDGSYFGSITSSNDGFVICDKDVAGRNGTLTISIYIGNGASERRMFKTIRLRNYQASWGGFNFFEANGKLVMSNGTGDLIWGMSVYKLTGVLGTIVEYADEAHSLYSSENATYYWNQPKTGDRLVLNSPHPIVNIVVTLTDEYYVDQTVSFDGQYDLVSLEFLLFKDSSANGGYQPVLVVNGVPQTLNVSYQYSHGGM